MTMNPDDTGWKTLRRSTQKVSTQRSQTSMATGDMKGRVPAALVHPFTSGEGEMISKESEGLVPSIPLRPQYSTTNLPSPYLLSAQVQEIQNRLSGDVTGSQEYQQLLSEKLYLEETLGSTEYSLHQLSAAYNDLKKSSTASEKECLLKLRKAEERSAQVSEEKQIAWKRVEMQQQYLSELPTAEEHYQLQDKLCRQTEEVTRLSAKVDHLVHQVKRATEHKGDQAAVIETLRQEKDDLALKLTLTEKILKEVDDHRKTACEEGEHSMEELLWTLEQKEKELDSAKKLVNYRKQKLDAAHKELLAQDKKYSESLQEEAQHRERLEDTVKNLERTVQHHKQMEEKVRSKLGSTEEKLKRIEERLEVALGEVTSQQKISSVVAALMSSLQTVVNQLRDLVIISQQISKGQTPDITLLLNFTESQEERYNSGLSLEALSAQLKEVKQMLQQLESVRLQLQEQYAQQLASDVTCAQM